MKIINRVFILSLFYILVVTDLFASGASSVKTISALTKRLLPKYSASFVYKEHPSKVDFYSIQSKNGKVIITGNNANSMAVGLNYYIKNYCHSTISWFVSDPVEMPDVLPMVEKKIEVKANIHNRFFLNYCTFGYTMPWWGWKEWEHFIDWMALNGINMPLAITGQEAIWYNVWKKFGLTDTEIRSYFTGPAHLPWHRMSNIDAWQGPLPVSWLENQKELQKKIVSRERELNMRPVLPAFSGHIPSALKRIFPKMKCKEVSEWCCFAPNYHCTFLYPMDSLYSVIQKEYLVEQTKMYGTDHIYGVDPFNEVDPPTWDSKTIRSISSHIYKSMQAIDKDAIWLQMAWLFINNPDHWTDECKRALIEAVPRNKMILLDYFCEEKEIWRTTDSFYGQPFIWCYLGNFGGNTMMCGPVNNVSRRLAGTFKDSKKNFYGIGVTLEGFGVNQFAYEFVMDKAWNIPQSDKGWINSLADRRVGFVDDNAREAWKILADSVLLLRSTTQGTMIEKRPSLESGENELKTDYYSKSQQRNLVSAWKKLAKVSSRRDTYNFDMVNIGRQALGGYFHELRDSFTVAYKAKDIAQLKLIGAKMKKLIMDVDRLLACNSNFSFANWLQSARTFGVTLSEKEYYEKNARTIVTAWGDTDILTDYARRGWSGLMRNYYYPRWQWFIDDVTECARNNYEFNQEDFKKKCNKFERSFIETSFPLTYSKSTDGIALSISLLNEYFK